MSKYWRNRVAVVSGVSTEVGDSIILMLANMGVVVVGLTHQVETFEQLNGKRTGEGRIYGRYCDMGDERSILNAFNWIKEKFVSIHIFISYSEPSPQMLLSESYTSRIKNIIDRQLFAATLCLRDILRHMKGLGNKGHIILLNRDFNQHLCQLIRQDMKSLQPKVKFTNIVERDNTEHGDSEKIAMKLNPEDIVEAVRYALETPDHLQLDEIILNRLPSETPIDENSSKQPTKDE